MDQPLAVILGAGPGIGLATGRRFARGGLAVALVARPGDPLDAFQRAVAAEGVPALAVAADLARAGAAEAALAAVARWRPDPAVLVCNASAGAPGPAADLDPDQLQADLRVGVGSALAAVRWALPAMRRAGRGTLLFTGGGLALAPKPGLAAACLGKAAQRSLALSLAAELAPEGIHAALLTVRGFVQPGTPLAPDRVAEAFWELHSQPRESWELERLLG